MDEYRQELYQCVELGECVKYPAETEAKSQCEKKIIGEDEC